MRWPWVGRDAMNEWEGRELSRLWAELDDQQTRYDDLLEKYHALKVQGATVREAPPPPVQVDPVIAAINEASNRDPKLRALMSREAQRMRLAGFEDHQIIQQIQDGVTPEGLPA